MPRTPLVWQTITRQPKFTFLSRLGDQYHTHPGTYLSPGKVSL